MVSSNQRSIYQSIQKVVGSSNRGFISLDPERQARIGTLGAKASPAMGADSEFRAPAARPGTIASGSSSSGRR